MCSAEASTCSATSAPGVGWMRRTHPVRRRSICHWKVFPALRRPKVIRKNSNSPKGVAMAVFSMSPGCIRIWR
jgi:hypothetical protein